MDPSKPPPIPPPVIAYRSPPPPASPPPIRPSLDDDDDPPMLHRGAAIPALIYIVASTLLSWPRARDEAVHPVDVLPTLVGQLCGGFILTLIVTWVVWRASRRTQRVATIVFSVMMLFMIVTSFLSSRPGHGPKAKLAIDVTQKTVDDKVKAADKALVTVRDMRALSANASHSSSLLQQKIGTLYMAITASEELLAAGDGAEADIARYLHSMGAGDTEQDGAVQLFRKQYGWPSRRLVFQQNLDIMRAARDELEYLRDHFGEWDTDSDTQDVHFQMGEGKSEFDRLDQKLQAALRVQPTSGK